MTPARLSNTDLAALSAPTLIFAVYELAHRVLLPEFLTRHVGLDIALVGVMLAAVRLLDILFDTVVGGLSDMGPSARMGRRRLWMAFGLLPALAGVAATFSLPSGAGALAVAGWLVVMMAGWSAINSAHGALALSSGNGVGPRSRIFAFRGMAGVLGYLAFSAVMAAGGPDLQLDPRWVILAVAIGAPLTTAILFWRIPDPPSPPVRLSLAAMLEPFALGLRSRRRRWLTLLFGLVGAHAAISSGSFIFMLKYGFGLPDAVGPALLWQAAAMIAGLPVFLGFSRRFGPRWTLAAVFAAEAVTALGALLLPVGRIEPLIAWAALRGFVSGMDFALLRAYAGTELDEETARSGEVRAGGFYAAFHLYYNLASAVATGVLLSVYGAFGLDGGAAFDHPQRLYVAIPVCACALTSLTALAVSLGRPGSAPTGAHIRTISGV